MKKIYLFLSLVVLLVFVTGLVGCLTPPPSARVQSSGGSDMGTARAESYHGPRAAIAVADFEDKTVGRGEYRPAYGRGMADMLVTSLFNTNRFIVLEREKLDAVIHEQDMGASGRFRQDTAAPIGELEGAQLLVVAAVTGFDPNVAGTSGSASQIGGLLGLGRDSRVGQVMGGHQRAHVAIDLRIVDTATGRILSATSVQGSAQSFDLGGSILGSTASGGLSTYARTPMEQAIRRAIDEATAFVASQTPPDFYRH